MIDLTDVDAFQRGEHHRMFAWLRAEDPVHWQELPDGGGFWALTRYDDVVEAYGDHGTFLSSGGAMLGGSYRNNQADSASGRMLVASDPPRHRLLRQRMHRIFNSAMVARIAQQVSALVTAALARAVAAGGCDFATELAPELPAGALMCILGIGHCDAHALIDMTRRMIGFRDANLVDVSGDERLRLAAIQAEIFDFFDQLLAERRSARADDLVSLLATTDLNGRKLPEEEILYNCLNVAVGGNETTSHAACAGVVALAERPDQYDLLLETPDVVEPAISEILRWSSTNAYVQRIVARDTLFAGRPFRQGEAVTLWNVSANRDAEQFRDPERFDITREPNRHLSYGYGIHRCIGAILAHTELSVLLGHLAGQRIRMELAGPPQYLRSNFILGVTSLPVKLSGT